MIRFQILLLFITVGLTLYAFIDCAQKDESEVRNLPKWGWLLIILFISTIGPIAWFIAGRPKRQGPRPPKRRILPPDDDPDFLKKI